MTATRFTLSCSYEDSTGRDMAAGDGITRSASTLLAVCATHEHAERLRAEIQALVDRCVKIPGDGHLWPVLSLARETAAPYIPAQDRRRYGYPRWTDRGGKQMIAQADERRASMIARLSTLARRAR